MMLRFPSAIAPCALLLLAAAGQARASLVANGSFESTTGGPDVFFGFGMTLNNWTYSGGVATVYGPASADTTGALQGGNPIYLWGPGNGASNGLTASPDGGNYLASDSDPTFSGTYSQTITGLTPGNQYVLSFLYGAAQYRSTNGALWNGASHSGWQVTFGAETFTTASLNIASHGFSGWQSVQHTFTATSASQVLSFFAVGGPGGLPPVALLDGVVLNDAVPEPAAWTLIVPGLAGLLAAAKSRNRRQR